MRSFKPAFRRGKFRKVLNRFFWGLMAVLGCALLSAPAGAQDASAPTATAPATIETHWNSLWGMKYYQSGTELSELQLKSILYSGGDPQIRILLGESDSDESLGTLGLCTSVAASLFCLVLPSTDISVGTLKVTVPYLPVQIPALAIGVIAAFFKNAGGAAQFAAVQRYNAKAVQPDSLTWNLTPESNGLVLDLNYAL